MGGQDPSFLGIRPSQAWASPAPALGRFCVADVWGAALVVVVAFLHLFRRLVKVGSEERRK
jgi:hypothetical protein